MSHSILSALSEDLLVRVYGFLDPTCRKTWRLVSREFHRVDSLSRTSIRILRVEFLPALLFKYPNLSSLDLSVCPKLDDDAVLRIALDGAITNDSVRSIALLPKLEVLDMVSCPLIDDAWLQYLEKWLSFTTRNICDNIKPLKHLKTLWIDGARISDSSLLTLTSSCRALPELGVSRCVGVTDGGMGLARNCSNLKALNLACCGFATDAAISAVVQSCLNLDVTPSVFESSILLTGLSNEYISKCSHLLRLKLGLCANVSDKGIFHIGSKCSKLLELDLYRCAGFGDDGLAAISRGCKSLNRLILSYCGELTDAGVEKIHLSHLELRGIKNITGTGLCCNYSRLQETSLLGLKLCENIDGSGFWAVAYLSRNLRQVKRKIIGVLN
ncbi:hypothetical protein DY000_02025939 [Brassica cretica]|uniref:F-box/LRR-repeat protein 15-like leucin rich repeat domain-containing protein n=1 Tax=Brassica cretica TaxID=69181 RepID=A0ABQ7EGT0_BRACR|nr:hypothetical protein DY000_02025939 [Brassica cretica]